MISKTLQIVMIIAIAVYFFLLILLLKKKRLLLKYSLLWLFAGLIMLTLAIYPGIINRLSNVLGIYSPVNALFAIILFCVIILLVSLTSIVSAQNEKIKRLIQREAHLEKDILVLKKKESAPINVSSR